MAGRLGAKLELPVLSVCSGTAKGAFGNSPEGVGLSPELLVHPGLRSLLMGRYDHRSPPLPSFVEAAELNAKIAADEIKIALGSSNDAPVLTPIDYDASDIAHSSICR